MKLIYAGFDGLDVTFKGCIPLSAVEVLEGGKEAAQELKQRQYVEIGDFKGHVGPTGLRDGGYSFIVDTGDLGFTWFMSKSQRKENWGIRVSCKSATLAAFGFEQAVARMYDELDAIGATVLEESISRVDFAMDWRVSGDFRIDPDRFSMHGTTTLGQSGDEWNQAWRGQRCTGFTIGKMPGRQICIYDKRLEVVKKQKGHWWSIWDIDRDELDEAGDQIWRLEIRAGKKHLKEHWGITRWPDLRKALGDIFKDALVQVRYKSRAWEKNENVSRIDDDEFWCAAKDCITRDLSDWSSNATPGVIKQVMEDQQRQTITAQLVGLSANLAVLSGMDHDKIAVDLPAQIATLITDHVRGPKVKDFKRKMRKVTRRYEIIDRDGVVRGGPSDTRYGHSPNEVPGMVSGSPATAKSKRDQTAGECPR
ncbi:MAG: hypothetical protein CMO05_08550 [Thalassospira sp.]|uniref:hypothetical protein n=1 Tax=Thalassospira sp. GB04J01 TaxID=1485225 RepID=UPI000C0E4409|nr:hypothetical protein [Thalassospira sp. GB04J01]MBV17510.1 hypothetical protein [Thalassospira sp.]|tara:strand:- start:39661 stop:40926 length:1266 start_codon:yes stop_codon:yes gene_type:complete